MSFGPAGWFIRQKHFGWAFIMTGVTIACTVYTVFATLYPHVMISSLGDQYSLDIYNASSPANSMRTALAIYVFGMALVIVYLVNVYRVWKGKSQSYHI